MNHLLTFIVFWPLIIAVGLLFVSGKMERAFRTGALVAFGGQLLASVFLWINFDSARVPTDWNEAFQFVVKVPWIRFEMANLGALNVDYHVGVDGISAPLLVLASLILLIGAIASWSIKEKLKGYFILYLILGTSVVGCFVALDFFLFYVFFEFMLLPMFFLIGIWGGARRQYASIKFFLYTLLGSLFILIVMIGLYLSVDEMGQSTFSFIQILNPSSYLEGSLLGFSSVEILGYPARTLAFWLLIIGFAIKLPTFPFHTWLPDAHVEAPTPISVVLAGLLLKVGGYGLLRIGFGFFPDQAILFAQPLAILGVVSIIYGGLNAMAQNDLKRLVAYSSVSHMGFVFLGLATLSMQGVSGALFHMVSHGLLSPALFLIVGVIYDRTQNREIENFSGLASQMPKFTFIVGLVFFASLGLPGLSGFVGELLVLMSAFASEHLSAWVGPVAVSGILVSAAYFLWTIQRMFFGEYWVREDSWQVNMVDLTTREWLVLAPLGILVVLLGIFPSLLLDPINASLNFWVEQFQQFPK